MKPIDRIRYILRKHPETKYNRAEFFWRYLEEFRGVRVMLLKKDFLAFWKEEATLERTLRKVLKEPEFKIKPELDQKRYEKASQFRKSWKV